jgi:hypothetical protein
MAKKTITKEHPLTAFRKANEARDVVVKSSMKKMQTGGTMSPKSNALMLDLINKNPAQYKRDRTPDVKKIYTDRNIPLTGPMTPSDSSTMADVETNIWNDVSGAKARRLAIGCKKQKTGGSIKTKKK